jgi:TrmH family RNA methyltransferase
LRLERQQKLLLSKRKKSISVPHCKIQQRIIQDYTTPTALVVGTEATGLTQEWRDAATQNIIIPMQVKSIA